MSGSASKQAARARTKGEGVVVVVAVAMTRWEPADPLLRQGKLASSSPSRV
jgi:hypothetical protein